VTHYNGKWGTEVVCFSAECLMAHPIYSKTSSLIDIFVTEQDMGVIGPHVDYLCDNNARFNKNVLSPLPKALFSDFRKTDPISVKFDVEGKLKWFNGKVRCLLAIILITILDCNRSHIMEGD